MKRVFWWRGVPNFGDDLARVLVEEMLHERVAWAPPRRAELVVTGSVATMLPDGWDGTICGIGWARPDRRDFSRARVLALRGRLSQELYGGDVPALGDPGLLAPWLLPPLEERGVGIVVVPHWQDRDLARKWPNAEVVSVGDPPLKVIDRIRRARRVVSSSLHGIVVADAYGIERRWETFPGIQGGGFKFRDHASVVGHLTPGEWGRVDPVKVTGAQEALVTAFAAI